MTSCLSALYPENTPTIVVHNPNSDLKSLDLNAYYSHFNIKQIGNIDIYKLGISLILCVLPSPKNPFLYALQ